MLDKKSYCGQGRLWYDVSMYNCNKPTFWKKQTA